MKILMVSSEIFPLAKTGGLADAVGALARTLARLGNEISLVLPAYRTVLENIPALAETGLEVRAPLAGRRVSGAVLKTLLWEKIPTYLIRADSYFLREGLYGDSHGDYPDNAERFVFFCKAALELAERLGPWDVIHCNDWQTALIPVLKQTHSPHYPKLRSAKSVLTIHNLAHQGSFPFSLWNLLDLDESYFTPRHLEFFGNFNLLKGGILFADAITTVSRRYASEIKTPEYGCGLEGVIGTREKELYGILNGVDYQEWNPESDPHIRKNYTPANLHGKQICKLDLLASYGLPYKPLFPLMGMVSRLVDQKGLDILVDVLDDLMQLDLQLVVLGAGEQKYQSLLPKLASRYPETLGVKIGFDNALAHKIEAGSDLFLMPSKFEPCGLNQMFSLKYGTIPVVRATGGLDDTIEDYSPPTGTGNGFKFRVYSGPTLLEAIKRAIAVYHNRTAWRHLMAQAMACDFSWESSATQYLSLYRKLVESGTAAGRGNL